MRSLVNQFLLSGVLAIVVGLLGVWTGSIVVVLLAGLLVTIPSAMFAQSAVRRLARLQVIASEHYGEVPPTATVDISQDEIDEALHTVSTYAALANSRSVSASERNRYLNLILDRVGDGLLIVDADGRVAYANVAAALLFGGVNPVSRRLIEVCHDHDLDAAVKALARGCTDAPQSVRSHVDGKTIEYTLTVLRETPREVLMIARDVTEMQHLLQLRSDFVANVSHELRTPLSTIKILTETLLEITGESDDANAARFLGQIDAEVDSMTALVRDLLSLTRLETAGGELVLSDTSPAMIVRDVVARMRPLAAHHGVAVHFGDSGISAPISVDRQRLEQALVNLLTNALAHTPDGGEVFVLIDQSATHTRFVVRDTGRGIAAEDLPRIWERFFKTDRSRSGPGTGLGLAIVKHIVQAHGGTVAVESTPGRGSEFSIEIPNRPDHSTRAVDTSVLETGDVVRP